MGILIQNPGMFTTIQDQGRFGYQEYGVTVSGAMDLRAMRTANLLVGNALGEGIIEMTFQGPEILFENDSVIAITGADMCPTVNEKPVEMYKALRMKKGDLLAFSFATNGCRGYVAFAGGLDIPVVMESKSTLASKKMGGYEGRKLERGDHIALLYPGTEPADIDKRVLEKMSYPTKEIVLRVVRGPQDYCFSEEEIKKFFWYGFEITNDFDRMGCRLSRKLPIKHLNDGNIISDGIVCGSIQVPTNGQPIIMLADRQTVGGYTKIATVITPDLSKLAQARPGMHVRFVEVSIELAQELLIRELEEFDRAEQIFNSWK